MAETKTVFEFEFAFANGTVLYETVEEGRDAFKMGEGTVHLMINEPDGSVREVVVNRPALAYARTTKREVPVEAERAVVVS